MLSSLLGRLRSDLPSSFGYVVGEVSVASTTLGSAFALHTGTSKQDGSQVSVFVFDNRLGPEKATLARNCLHRLKTVRHPYVLRVLEAVEAPSGIYIATECVKPLPLCSDFADPSWGMYQLTTAVSFLGNECKVVHGLVAPHSIFVTANGNWRLANFELCRPLAEATTREVLQDVHRHEVFEVSRFEPPAEEVGGKSPASIDRWGVMCVGCWVYAVESKQKEGHHQPAWSVYDDLDVKVNRRYTPEAFQKFCASLKAVKSPDLSRLLKHEAYFAASPVLKVVLFLEQINLKGNWEKEVFFEQLPELLNQLPPQIQVHQVLPELCRQVEFFSKPTLLLPSILRIGERVSTGDAGVNEFKAKVMPTLTKLFSSNDRAIRYALLANISTFDQHLDQSTTSELFEPVALGFTDSSAPLREVTLKSMICFLPKLKKSSLIDKAVRLMMRLQQDPEGTIRTNAVICFAKVAQSLPKDQATKVLSNVYMTALRDPFPPCRLAALQAIGVGCSQELFPLNEVATRLMPNICLRAVDNDHGVKLAAIEILRHMISLLQQAAERRSNGSREGGSAATPSTVADPQQTGDEGWTGWALKKAFVFYGAKSSDQSKATDGSYSMGLMSAAPSPTVASPMNRQDFGPSSGEVTAVDRGTEEFHDIEEIDEGISAWDGGKWDEDFDDLDSFKPVNVLKSKKETRTSGPLNDGRTKKLPSGKMELSKDAVEQSFWKEFDIPEKVDKKQTATVTTVEKKRVVTNQVPPQASSAVGNVKSTERVKPLGSMASNVESKKASAANEEPEEGWGADWDDEFDDL